MKKIYSLLIAGATAVYMLPSCSHDHSSHDHGNEGEHTETHNEHDGHAHQTTEESADGADEIILKPETAARFGVATDTVSLKPAWRTIKVTGQIISSPSDASVVTAPTSGIVSFVPGITTGHQVKSGAPIARISSKGLTGGDPNESARASMEAAKRELDRIAPLHQEGIVSTREYNAAQAAYDAARAAYSGQAASGTASATTSGAITSLLVSQGQYVDAGAPIATVSSNTRLTLQADLPEKYLNFLPLIDDANIRLSYSDTTIPLSSLNGKRITTSAAASSTLPGYIPVVFTFDNNGTAISGAMTEVYLKAGIPGESVVLPLEAISEQQGRYFVYVKVDDHGYVKTPVEIAGRDGQDVIISSGLTPGDQVVTHGASIVRMAETSGVVPEGHHHH